MGFTSDQVKEAVQALKDIRPAYTTLLNFYEQIFVAQQDSSSRIHIDPITISREMVAVKLKEKFPLININEFAIDAKAAADLFNQLCGITEAAGGDMSRPAGTIRVAVETEKLDPMMFFTALLKEDDALFERIAGELEIDKKILAFITYNSMKPSLALCAKQLSSYLDQNITWGKGYCPICGSAPGLSMFEGEGERFLFCGFCWHKYPARRIYCPFCENMDSETLEYFYSEEEEEYRVDICQKCKKYIKTIDTRKTERMIYPPLEQVATLHLDIKAKETGLESGLAI
jgi:FdhE protein